LRFVCHIFITFPGHHHPRSTLFPYTTLFRSELEGHLAPAISSWMFFPTISLQRSRMRRHIGPGLPVPMGTPLNLVTGARQYGVVDRKSTRLNSSHVSISYAVFCLKKKISRSG